jgi:hypothetical protein
MKAVKVGLAAALAASFTCSWVSAAAARDHSASEVTVAARQRFFGAENVDPRNGKVRDDRVIFSWITNAGYAVSFRGRVVLLDTYINRFEVPPTSGPDLRRTPFGAQDLIDLHPEAIFLGHGHGDHADNAAYIAKWLNIPIYSTPETCDVMQQDVARMAADPNTVNGGAKLVPDGNPVNCIGVGAARLGTGYRGCQHQSAQTGSLHRRLQAHSLRHRSDRSEFLGQQPCGACR